MLTNFQLLLQAHQFGRGVNSLCSLGAVPPTWALHFGGMPLHQRYDRNPITALVATPNGLSTTATTKTRRIILWHEQSILFRDGLHHTTMSLTGKTSRPGSRDPINCACPELILLNASSADNNIDLVVFSPCCRTKKYANACVICSFRQFSLYFQYYTSQALRMTFEPSGKKEMHQEAMTPRLVSLCAENRALCVSSSRCFSPL